MTDQGMAEEAKIREERMALENATPRPWRKVEHSWAELSLYDANGVRLFLMDLQDWGVTEDNEDALSRRQASVAEFTLAAVNSYDPSREEKVRALIKVATKSLAVMRECGWQIATASEPQGDGVLQAAAVECHDELDAALKALEE